MKCHSLYAAVCHVDLALPSLYLLRLEFVHSLPIVALMNA